MAEYPNFKHGTRGEIVADALRGANSGNGKQAIVYIGTAPVHLIEGSTTAAGLSKVLNRPVLINDITEARKIFGYSEDWASYTLCEAMHVHFELNAIGPVVFINVLDPTTNVHKTGGTATVVTLSLTPVNGKVTIATDAEQCILDTIVVKKGSGQEETTLVKGTDYIVNYNYDRKTIDIIELTSGVFGTSALSVTYNKIDPSTVTTAQVIGASDGYGSNTGIYAVKSVYNVTGYIPAYLLAPGFSSLKEVHDALYANSQKIAGHWNAWIFSDIPIVDGSSNPITLATAPTWKNNNGYNKDNESVFFPLAKGTDGKIYHLSVLNAANFQMLLIQNDGIPYMSGSNTACGIIEDLYFGEANVGKVYTDDIINRCLNANGINSAAYVGGRWAIWGMFAGSYNQDNATSINVNDTCLMMLYYLTNDFQHRRNIDIDKPMTVNTLKSIIAEEQARVDALLGIGALTYGKVTLDATREARADVYQGDFRVIFNVTNTPLAKSLTAIASWTDEGFQVYFAAMDEML